MPTEELLIDFSQGEHSGKNMAQGIWETMELYGLNSRVSGGILSLSYTSNRCGSASHCETLSIAVASLCHQITLSQPPIAFTCSISLFAVFPLRTSPFW